MISLTLFTRAHSRSCSPYSLTKYFDSTSCSIGSISSTLDGDAKGAVSPPKIPNWPFIKIDHMVPPCRKFTQHESLINETCSNTFLTFLFLSFPPILPFYSSTIRSHDQLASP